MKRNKTISILLTAIIAVGTAAFGASQSKCPVMGGKIDRSQYADVNGKRIYVCCKGCIAKIKAEPAKYIKQLESKGIEFEKADAKKDTSASKGGCGH